LKFYANGDIKQIKFKKWSTWYSINVEFLNYYLFLFYIYLCLSKFIFFIKNKY